MNNHLSSRITEYKKTTTHCIVNPGSDLGQTQTCGGIKPDKGTPLIIGYLRQYIYKQTIKTFRYSLPPTRLYTVTKNEWQHKHGHYNS